MLSLNEDIKNKKFEKLYLFCGDEAYLKRQYKNRMKKAIIPEDDTLNYAYFEGNKTSVSEIIDLADTMPFFSDKRLIVIENSGFFKEEAEQLTSYLSRMPDTTCIIFVEEEIDKRGRLFKAVKQNGRVVEFATQNENTLVKWIKKLVADEKRSMSNDVVLGFLNKTGTDMENIYQELEKVLCYTIGKSEITMKDVDAVCTEQIQNQIFKMVDAIGEKKQKQALEYYYDLMALKEPPMKIMYLISRQFTILLEVKELMQKGYNYQAISEKTGYRDFAVKRYQSQARQFATETLKSALYNCAAMEEAVKTGKLNDSISVELLIVRYSAETN